MKKLSLLDVTKTFHLDDKAVVTPTRNVTLEIEQGEFIVIVGRSGSGKSTLLNLAAGLVRPTSGHVLIDGVNLSSMDDRQLSSLRGQRIGFVFQFPSMLPSLTAKENVSLPTMFANGTGRHCVTERTSALLGKLGLTDKLDAYPRQLSAGEQKRIAIARSLINDPQLVLADEPTSDLDYRTENEVMELLKDINSRGTTFLVVTHSLELLRFADRAFEMDSGTLTSIK